MSYNLLSQMPINVSVDGLSSYAVIVWLAEDTAVNECEGRVKTPIPFSQKIYIEPLECGSQENVVTGTIESSLWGGNRDVTYRITQLATKDCDCDPYKELDPGVPHDYGIISSITMPYFLEGEKTETVLSVTYYESFLNECGVPRITTSVTSVTLHDDATTCESESGERFGTSAVTIGGRSFSVPYAFYHTRPTSCCSTSDTILSGKATYTPSIVQASGVSRNDPSTYIKMTFPYVKITYDEDCVETRTTGISSCTITSVDPNAECYVIKDAKVTATCGNESSTFNAIGLNQAFDSNNCTACTSEERVWYEINLYDITDTYENGYQESLRSQSNASQLEFSIDTIVSIKTITVNNVKSFSAEVSTYPNISFVKSDVTRTSVDVSELIGTDNTQVDAFELEGGGTIKFKVEKEVTNSPFTITIQGTNWGGSVNCCGGGCQIVPSHSTGNGGIVRFDIVSSGGESEPTSKIPYYGGTAYARIIFSAYTQNQDCCVTSCNDIPPCVTVTTGETVIEVDVEPIPRDLCNEGKYICNSYEIIYGVDCNNEQNKIDVCVAQSVNCKGEDSGCDSDAFSLTPTSCTVTCFDAYDKIISTYGKACIDMSEGKGVSAYTDANWLVIERNQTNNRPNIVVQTISANTNNFDRTASIIIQYNLKNAPMRVTEFIITQKKCAINCDCSNMKDDVPIKDSNNQLIGTRFISATTEILPAVNFTTNDPLWVFHIDNDNCEYDVCPTIDGHVISDGTVYDVATIPYQTPFSAITAKITDNEDTENDRKFNIKFTFDGSCENGCTSGSRYDEDNEITQSRFICDCGKLYTEHSKSSIYDISVDGGNGIVIGQIGTYVGHNGEPICAKSGKITFTVEQEGSLMFVHNVSAKTTLNSNGSVDIVGDVDANPSSDVREFVVNVYISSEKNGAQNPQPPTYCFSMNGLQEGKSCECGSITYTARTVNVDCNARTFTAFTFSLGDREDCYDKISVVTSADFISARKEGNDVVCTVSQYTDFRVDREAYVSLYMNGNECTNAKVKVIQERRCPIYTIDPNNGSGPSGSKTFTIIES